MNPEISVLMPVYNGCRNNSDSFLKQAIESILDQTFENFEFVIVNDGSTDGTIHVLNQYAARDKRIKIINNSSNLKIMKSLNIGLQNCSAPLVARQDADDISTTTRLEIEKKFLDDRPETVLCGTGMYVIDEGNHLIMEIQHPCNYQVLRNSLKNGCFFVHGSVMFRKDPIIAAGGYSTDQQYLHAEDYELWVRLAAKYSVENIPNRTLYFHRDHKSKIGNVFKREQEIATQKIIELARKML